MTNNSSSPADCNPSPDTPVHPSSDVTYFGFNASDQLSEYTIPEQSSSPAFSSGSQSPNPSKDSKVDIGATRKRIQAHQQATSEQEAMEIDALFVAKLPLQDRSNSLSPVKIVRRSSQPSVAQKENVYNGLEGASAPVSGNRADLRRRYTDGGFQPSKRTKLNEPLKPLPRKAASLRKAESLRADAEKLPSVSEDLIKIIPPFITKEDEDELIKTIAAVTARPEPHTFRALVDVRKKLPSPRTPILSTKQDHIPILPHSEEAQAKVRLQRLKERETVSRDWDGLSLEAIHELEHVDELDSALSSPTSSQETESDLSVRDAANRFSVEEVWATAIGLRDGSRVGITNWLLKTSRNKLDEKYEFDLPQHLKESPETHFHAVHMLLRYFYIANAKHHAANVSSPFSSDNDPDSVVAWDIALGSLALSVKFHRDTLRPLYPISTDQFIRMAPHVLDFDDIETAQCDILVALSYSLGATPELILGELWTALPSLRLLLSFPNGWAIAQRETWWLLHKAISNPAILRFPLTVLTAAALSEALVVTFKNKYQFEGMFPEDWRRDATRGKKDFDRLSGNRVRRAIEETKSVVEDVQEVLGVSDVELCACRLWFSLL